MKLSIITINYNNAAGLQKTIDSVVAQSFHDFEYIVIDGASTDSSVDIINRHAESITHWVSEPDSGVYNAMNKGIQQAKGEYLLFVNSGDYLYNNDILAEVFAADIRADLIYGDIERVYPDGHTDVARMPDWANIPYMLGSTLAHPAAFLRKTLFDKYGLYREDLRIVSDWAFFLKIIAFGRITKQHIPMVVTSFLTDGMSNSPANKAIMEKETETVLKDYFSLELLDICTSYDKYYNFYHQPSTTRVRQIGYAIKKGTSIRGWRELVYRKRIKPVIRLINNRVRQQRKDPLSIPIIIISYNRLADLQKLVASLLSRKHSNIVIVDNQSTYPPLLEYYSQIEDRVTIERMDKNYGHLVFWKNRELYNKYASGYHIITDSDIIPNKELPNDYIQQMLHMLDKHNEVTKVGFALNIDDIPDSFVQKPTVIDWEKRFWKDEISKDVFRADLDTTFAIYPPFYDFVFADFYNAIRMAGNYTARHGGWYMDSRNLSDEDKYYFSSSSNSNSWKLDENGELKSYLY